MIELDQSWLVRPWCEVTQEASLENRGVGDYGMIIELMDTKLYTCMPSSKDSIWTVAWSVLSRDMT